MPLPFSSPDILDFSNLKFERCDRVKGRRHGWLKPTLNARMVNANSTVMHIGKVTAQSAERSSLGPQRVSRASATVTHPLPMKGVLCIRRRALRVILY